MDELSTGLSSFYSTLYGRDVQVKISKNWINYTVTLLLDGSEFYKFVTSDSYDFDSSVREIFAESTRLIRNVLD